MARALALALVFSLLFRSVVVRVEAETNTTTLRGSSFLALGALDRSFKGTQSTNLLKDPFGFELVLESLESTVNGLTLFYFYVWHGLVS